MACLPYIQLMFYFYFNILFYGNSIFIIKTMMDSNWYTSRHRVGLKPPNG